MSRRVSRVSMNERHSDTLFEFENFKKKFLLANKHITKLNSTLSVRIEELNAQISALHVENLRLRASEIALGSQLKKEREKSQRVISDAESAVHSLIRSFGSIRKNFNIPAPKPPSPKKESIPKAHRPMLNPDVSPHVNRLARPPRVPEIFEEDEAGSDALEEDGSQSPTPVTSRKKPRPTSTSSRLLVPAPASATVPAPIVATIQVDINDSLLKHGNKRISRRQSGLINVTSSSGRALRLRPLPRPPSPAFGSPLRRDAVLAEEKEDYEALHGQRPANIAEEIPLERPMTDGRKKRTLTQAQAVDVSAEDDHEREKHRLPGDFEGLGPGLQDVTNALGAHLPLPPLDTNLSDQDCHRLPSDTDSDMPSALTYSSTRPPQSTPGTTPAPSHLSTPRNSSPPPISLPAVEPDAPTIGRERRVRKSINYAEPKLNTKMRKPDSMPPIKRTSSPSQPFLEGDPRSSLDSTVTVTERRRKSRPRFLVDDDESDGAQADDEPLVGTKVRAGLVHADRSLIEDDEGRRHSMLV
ncbi:hypothetical protein F5148DRAFT_1248544 [Russula earlei]|uniref:Uncharacterized protein n=1 Tax=Russula earlei TaxID=71964 RepID=A0ACC0TVN0_9AGAM|nr:hypothetical protein F5148DRAFT_1248544 [Russula earlei]